MTEAGGRRGYQDIAWTIRERINRRDLRPGDKIPSLNDLREDYGVSYPTAQAALALLKSWGLVQAEPGKGTFVLERRPVINMMTSMTIPTGGKRKTWREICAEYGMQGTQRVTGAGRDPVPADVADAFGAESDVRLPWRRRLLLADDKPIQISTSWYAEEVASAVPGLDLPERLPANSPELMAHAGFEIVGGSDLGYARGASDGEAALLRVRPGAHVSDVLRTCRSASGDVVSVERMVSDGESLRHEWRF
ncbi:GntR family transcriptional regulator [Frankia sp. Cj3]|uniref:GntR family transcriptional regulator n=1 Tax=Frankia sp. Cj3 TaxID=2880976 RepID=UPI001EF4AAD5|nr:GntR family transcriptional regulator [Frankia sp. Cj3]